MTRSARARVERRNRRRWDAEAVVTIVALFAGAIVVVIHPTDLTVGLFITWAYALVRFALRERRPRPAKPKDPGLSEIFR